MRVAHNTCEVNRFRREATPEVGLRRCALLRSSRARKLQFAWPKTLGHKGKGDSKMRFYGLCALVVLSQIPAFAQDTGTCGVFNGVAFQSTPCSISSAGQSLVGTWIAQVAMPGGAL